MKKNEVELPETFLIMKETSSKSNWTMVQQPSIYGIY